MKKTILLIVFLFSLFLFGNAQSINEETAVRTCLEQMFDGMRTGDSSLVRTVFHPTARMQTVFVDHQGKPTIREASLDAFLRQIGTPHSLVFDERIRRYEIRVDGLLATAWAEYTFYLGEEKRHCGTNAFQLFKSAEGWRITQITDTRQVEGCDSIPLGLAKDKMYYVHPIPFLPHQYICYRSPSAIQLDGKLDDQAWLAAPWTSDFVDIEGELKPTPKFRTRAKMLWDDDYFYFGAILEEPHIWGTLRQRDTIIFLDDDFEIFIDPDGDGHNYYEYEMNALNTVWDLLMLKPYHLGRGPNYVFNWNNPGLQSAVHIEGTLNDPTDEDEFWSVEIAFPWSALKELASMRSLPRVGDQWRLNFSRVDWKVDIQNGRYVKKIDPSTGKPFREENWVWSPTGRIDMHRPETWGYVQFSGVKAGEGEDLFQIHPDEKIKWALWQLFYQQTAFYEKYGWYSEETAHFTLPDVGLDGYRFLPAFYAGIGAFEIVAPGKFYGYWHINEMGKMGFEIKKR